MKSYKKLLEKLNTHRGILEQKRACTGFDGYIDSLYRVVDKRHGLSEYTIFNTISDFSERVRLASKRSADMEILLQDLRFGGNAPLTANCIAALGCPLKCIGLMGETKIHEAFEALHPNCTAISIGDPCKTVAFEFDDGKLMFGDQSHIHGMNWDMIKKYLGNGIFDIFDESDLIGIFNWSPAIQMNDMLHSIIGEILPKLKKRKQFFFDISDPSSRSRKDICEIFGIFHEMRQYGDVLLSVNQNELLNLYKHIADSQQYSRDTICITGSDNESPALSASGSLNEVKKTQTGVMKQKSSIKALDVQSEVVQPEVMQKKVIHIASEVFAHIDIDVLIVHLRDTSLCFSNAGLDYAEGIYINSPQVSTGGGDHFNGGFCAGRLMGLDNKGSLLLGNAASSYYVKYGHSAGYTALMDYIQSIYTD